MAKIFDILKGLGANTLYYPGCMLKNVMTKEQENYKQILNILGIDFVMLPNNEVCCGSPVMNAGYKKESIKLAKKNLEIFKKNNITKIITPCAGCYNMFKNEYPKLLREWDIEVEHATQTISKELKKRKLKEFSEIEVVTYHDPCHLGRFSNIYDEPREIIKMLGGELIEMKNNKENALCCGAGAGMRSNYPEIARKAAKIRMQEKPINAVFTLTPCGLCTSNLKTADDSVLEFSEWVLRRLK
jgi:heterodisulfide reductase subunit D